MDEIASAEQALSALTAISQVPVLAFSNGALGINSAEGGAAKASASDAVIVAGKSLGKFDSSAYMTDSELADDMKLLRETNEKIMQQNIALLADVEAMTEQLTRMRNEKAILASKIVQLSK